MGLVDDRPPSVNQGSSPEQKVALFRSLFRGREDVYAVRRHVDGTPRRRTMHNKLPDHELKLRPIKVEFLDGSTSGGTAEGNNAAWNCHCGALLVGRCYFQFGHTCYTRCERCGNTYRVTPDAGKKAARVIESAA